MVRTSVATKGFSRTGHPAEQVLHEMCPASLPGGPGKNGSDGSHQALVIVGDDEAHAGEPPGGKVLKEASPGGPVFRREGIKAQDLPVTLG